jgi:hypothetical protein
MQLCRKTGDRYREIEESQRRRVVERMQRAGAKPSLLRLITEGGPLDRDEAALIVGESLPTGLRLL